MTQRIVFPSFEPGGLAAPFDSRFGRCKTFTVVKQDKEKIIEIDVVQNSAYQAMGGAGIQAAQMVGNLEPTDVVVKRLGPNAYNALSRLRANIHQLQTNGNINVKQALDAFNAGKTQPLSGANVQSHYGMGRGGRGSGHGGGMGRGRGSGQGRGMGRGGIFQ